MSIDGIGDVTVSEFPGVESFPVVFVWLVVVGGEGAAAAATGVEFLNRDVFTSAICTVRSGINLRLTGAALVFVCSSNGALSDDFIAPFAIVLFVDVADVPVFFPGLTVEVEAFDDADVAAEAEAEDRRLNKIQVYEHLSVTMNENFVPFYTKKYAYADEYCKNKYNYTSNNSNNNFYIRKRKFQFQINH